MVEVVITGDGSSTIFHKKFSEHYHSTYGAINESLHVFIENGLKRYENDEIRILEIGLGTGLNAFLTALNKGSKKIIYHGLDAFPLDAAIISDLNYKDFFKDENKIFDAIHLLEWNKELQLIPGFSLKKICGDLLKFDVLGIYDLIYFDAFSPEIQPELWSMEIFKRLFRSLSPGGFLITYCAKGQVKRNLKESGFRVESLPGPKGKREMTRAWKSLN